MLDAHNSVQFSSVQDGIYALGKAHMRSAYITQLNTFVTLTSIPAYKPVEYLINSYRLLLLLVSNNNSKQTQKGVTGTNSRKVSRTGGSE